MLRRSPENLRISFYTSGAWTMEQHELRAWESRCSQEEPPLCQAACPLHVDVRAFMDAMGKGRFGEARKILERTMPLPDVLGRICEHPCETVCHRKDAGEPLAIGALERICLERSTQGKITRLPGRGRAAAILGAGLAGLAAAWDLAKKGYHPTVFHPPSMLGGALRLIPPTMLPPEVLQQELTRLQGLGATLEPLDRAVPEPGLLEELAARFPVACVDFSAFEADTVTLLRAACGLSAGELPDPVTMALPRAGWFAAGMAGAEPPGPMALASSGRRAATSMDRFLQGASLTASREREGPFATRLFTSVDGVPPLPRIKPAGERYTPGEAEAEAARCLNCQCLECVKVCAYLEHFKGYPKKYTREIYNNESIVKGLHQANKLINSCSLCGLCAKVCPHGFHMGELCAGVRGSMTARGKMPPSAHAFALADLAASTAPDASLAHCAPGLDSSAYLFFPGCQLAGSSPEQVCLTYNWLRQEFSGGVGLLLHCCGAPADWAGRGEPRDACVERIRLAWEEQGRPRIVTACPTCLEQLRRQAPDLPVTSLWELISSHGLPEDATGFGLAPLAVHDPCTTRETPALRDSVRGILGRLGCTVEELALGGELTECCGFGGLQEAANPALGRETALRRAARSSASYVTYCAMCRDSLARDGKPVLHLLDLLFPGSAPRSTTPNSGGDSGSAAGLAAEPLVRRAPGLADRRENRRRLRRKLLQELWQTPAGPREPWEELQLVLEPELQALLDKRRILMADLQKTIWQAERTGRKAAAPDRSRFLAPLREGGVTWWVEYTPLAVESVTPERYRILAAWSHRMHLLTGGE